MRTNNYTNPTNGPVSVAAVRQETKANNSARAPTYFNPNSSSNFSGKRAEETMAAAADTVAAQVIETAKAKEAVEAAEVVVKIKDHHTPTS